MPRRFPPFSAIRAFESTARLGRQTEAAKELGVSISAISHQIKALENYVGAPLFEKQSGQLRLSAFGSQLLAPLTGALNMLESTFANYPNRSGVRQLTIQTYKPFANLWLMPQLADFTTRFPDIPLSVLTSTKRPLESDVDMAVVYANSKPQEERCDLLFREVTTPVCSPDLLKMKGGEPTIERLASERLISSAKYMNAWQDWMSDAGVQGFHARPSLVVDDLSTGLQAAISGVGWVMGMTPLASWYKGQGALVAPFKGVLHETGYSYYLVISRHCVNREDALVFRDWLLKQCGREEDEAPGG